MSALNSSNLSSIQQADLKRQKDAMTLMVNTICHGDDDKVSNCIRNALEVIRYLCSVTVNK